MAEKKINSTKNINKTEVSDKELQEQINKLGEDFRNEEKVGAMIPKVLEKHLGPTLPIAINGVTLVIPVDGKTHKIPQSFAEHLSQYLENLNT